MEFVTLAEKKVLGLSARTGNRDPRMGGIIGGLWQRLFTEGIFFELPNKTDACSIGLYSDYSADGAEYDVTVGCEVANVSQVPEGLTAKTIPAGKYAKFVVVGDEAEAVGKAWTEIWEMSLDRTFTGDFEQYQPGPENGPREIHLYVAVR